MSCANYQVRVGNRGDLLDVMRLDRATPEAPHWAEAEYAAIVSSNGYAEALLRRCLFVADTSGGLVGFAVGKVVSGALGIAELESLAVSSSTRRMGVGRALCKAVIGWCREREATEIELEVRAGSGGAVALYKELGFAVVGQRGGYYRDPQEEALLMQLRLTEGK